MLKFEKIIKLKRKMTINIKQPNNNIETTYTFKNENKKFYYYHCNKRPVCRGKR